jgi:hypothetical protein
MPKLLFAAWDCGTHHASRLSPAPSHGMLGTTATAYFFKFCGRNPTIIVRWPRRVTRHAGTTTAQPARRDTAG